MICRKASKCEPHFCDLIHWSSLKSHVSIAKWVKGAKRLVALDFLCKKESIILLNLYYFIEQGRFT